MDRSEIGPYLGGLRATSEWPKTQLSLTVCKPMKPAGLKTTEISEEPLNA